jgi:hypothetical protein
MSGLCSNETRSEVMLCKGVQNVPMEVAKYCQTYTSAAQSVADHRYVVYIVTWSPATGSIR